MRFYHYELNGMSFLLGFYGGIEGGGERLFFFTGKGES